MSEVTAFPPLGCRGRLVDPSLIKNIRPASVDYAFLGEPILFRPVRAGKSFLRVYKPHTVVYDNLYVVSHLSSWVDDSDSIYSALRQPECYLALVDNEGEDPTWNVLKLWRVDFDTIPRHLLPPPGQMPLESC